MKHKTLLWTMLLLMLAYSVHAFPLYASTEWQDTGIAIEAGDLITITASGTVKIAGSDPGQTPDGLDPAQSGADRSKLVCPYTTNNYMLVGKIDGYECFEIGSFMSFTAENSGILSLAVNDMAGYFHDNSGTWNVEVTFSCPEGWTGDNCDIPVCDSCLNGACSAPDVCTCDDGWQGYDCNEPVCTATGPEIPGNSIDEDCDKIIVCDSSYTWETHDKFVSCVAKEASKLRKAKLIGIHDWIQIIREAARSDVGK